MARWVASISSKVGQLIPSSQLYVPQLSGCCDAFRRQQNQRLEATEVFEAQKQQIKGGNVVVFKENLLQAFSSWIGLVYFKGVSTGEVRKNRTYIKIARFSPAWGVPLLRLWRLPRCEFFQQLRLLHLLEFLLPLLATPGLQAEPGMGRLQRFQFHGIWLVSSWRKPTEISWNCREISFAKKLKFNWGSHAHSHSKRHPSTFHCPWRIQQTTHRAPLETCVIFPIKPRISCSSYCQVALIYHHLKAPKNDGQLFALLGCKKRSHLSWSLSHWDTHNGQVLWKQKVTLLKTDPWSASWGPIRLPILVQPCLVSPVPAFSAISPSELAASHALRSQAIP